MSIRSLALEIKDAANYLTTSCLPDDDFKIIKNSPENIIVVSNVPHPLSATGRSQTITIGDPHNKACLAYLYLHRDIASSGKSSFPSLNVLNILLQKVANREELDGEHFMYCYSDDMYKYNAVEYLANIIREMADIKEEYIDSDSENYLMKHIKLTPAIHKKILLHQKRYNIEDGVCAYYTDWDDFCAEWCTWGYTSRSAARGLLYSGTGEFMKLPNDLGYIRFVM